MTAATSLIRKKMKEINVRRKTQPRKIEQNENKKGNFSNKL